jgi:hypothetical protein
MIAIIWCRTFSPSLLSKNVKVQICKNTILLVLFGCETWSLTIREEGRLRVFENRVLRRIFGPKRNKVRGEWKKNYIMKNLMDLHLTHCCSGDQIEKKEMGGACSTYEDRRI